MSDYTKLADRLEAFASMLDPHKIAGHYSQAKIMREAAKAIRELDARQIAESNVGAQS